jgi:hypothetical protein
MGRDSAIPRFRELYDKIVEYRRHSLACDVLIPWIEKALHAIDELKRFSVCSVYDHRDEAALNAMWNLYALNRVNDLLLMSFQPGVGEQNIAPVSLDEYEAWFLDIGFRVVPSEMFSPSHHEIVQVHQSSEDGEAVAISKCLWPGLMFGDMLFSRSGVEVTGGRKYVAKDIAEQSTLYFAYRRKNRKTSDLSMGWGSNSQWRTSFRRDYQSDGTWIYNADGTNLLNADVSGDDRDGLTRDERIELCRNRCFIITSRHDRDLWPYDDRFEEPADS